MLFWLLLPVQARSLVMAVLLLLYSYSYSAQGLCLPS